MRSRQRDSLRGSIQDALDYVRKMISDGEYGCRFKHDTTKADICLFVETWVIPPLERALKKATKKRKAPAD